MNYLSYNIRNHLELEYKICDNDCSLNTDVALFFFLIIGSERARASANCDKKREARERKIKKSIFFFLHPYPLALAVI